MKVLHLTSQHEVKLLVKGQGVYLFNATYDEKNDRSFLLLNSTDSDGLRVNWTEKKVYVSRISDKTKYKDNKNKSGLVNLSSAYYWFSLDAQNQAFYAGVGEARMENVVFQYKFVFEPNQETERKDTKSFLESIVKINIGETKPIRLLRDPITQKVPLKVLGTDDITMEAIARGDGIPIANLSATSQKLYDCVSGKKFILNTPDFPEFSDAIEYSIRTPGLWCNTKIKEKATEFNKDKPNELETYLRITLGQNNGESPGIPYVMEIWPPGHYSPIHSHAGAEAIIRVLNGSIRVELYPFLCGQTDKVKPFGYGDFTVDEIAWVSPTLNQTHQIKNIDNKTTCMTIQCYMYGEENKTHYDYFDYVNADGKIEHYEPDSDMDFLSFKELMKKEWNEYNKNKQ